MTKNEWMVGIIGLLLGIVLTVGYGSTVFSRSHNGMGMTEMMKMVRGEGKMSGSSNGMMGSGSSMSMDDMMSTLSNKTGDDFDKEFIANMIVHHEGAVDMAEEAKQSAMHQEIKTLAENIISAQSKEITDMKNWYKSWYGVSVESEHNLHHR